MMSKSNCADISSQLWVISEVASKYGTSLTRHWHRMVSLYFVQYFDEYIYIHSRTHTHLHCPIFNNTTLLIGTLAENVFFRKLGPSYIEKCFRWAHEADPNAVLLYNDNKVEGMNGPNKSKADGFYRLLAGLVKNNVPIHGCGIQAHFNAAGTGRNRVPTPYMVKNQIHRLGNLGLRINISEMDVRVSQLAPELRQVAQRQIYHDIVAAALTEPAFDGVWLWGFTDKHTWVTTFYSEDKPLVFNEFYGRKDSYYGLRDALRTVIPGEKIGGSVLLDSNIDGNGNDWGHPWIGSSSDVDEFSGQRLHDGIDDGDQRPDWEL